MKYLKYCTQCFIYTVFPLPVVRSTVVGKDLRVSQSNLNPISKIPVQYSVCISTVDLKKKHILVS